MRPCSIGRGREVRLTAAGEVLLPRAPAGADGMGRGRGGGRSKPRTAQQATLAIGMSTSPGRGGLLPAIRSRFSLRAPCGEPGAPPVQLGGCDRWDSPTGRATWPSSGCPSRPPGRYGWIVVAEEPIHGGDAGEASAGTTWPKWTSVPSSTSHSLRSRRTRDRCATTGSAIDHRNGLAAGDRRRDRQCRRDLRSAHRRARRVPLGQRQRLAGGARRHRHSSGQRDLNRASSRWPGARTATIRSSGPTWSVPASPSPESSATSGQLAVDCFMFATSTSTAIQIDQSAVVPHSSRAGCSNNTNCDPMIAGPRHRPQ